MYVSINAGLEKVERQALKYKGKEITRNFLVLRNTESKN